MVKDRENFFKSITTQAAEGISVADEDGKYIYVNPAFCEMIGYSVEELLQMTVFDVKSENQDTTSFSRTKSTKEGLPVQVYLKRKDGSEFFSEVLGKVVDLGDETVIVGIIRDITDYLSRDDEALLLERQMQHTQKLESLGVLAGGIAHDFNNLLMVILGNADLAINNLSPMSAARNNLIEIEKASRRAADLSKQMLAYSGKGQFVVEPIYLGELVKDMAHLFEVSTSKKVTLSYDLEDNLPTFEGDATQIHQIIMNLITNASESIGDEVGVVNLSSGTMYCDRNYLDSTETVKSGTTDAPLEVGDYIVISVTDNGSGMDEKTISKVFDPFFTTKFTGRGLGMSAVQGIVRGHSGAIKVDSEIGKGTTFKILFHIDKQLQESVKSSPNNAPTEVKEQQEFSGTVLVVDDEEMVSEVAQQMLEYLGFDVLTASDGLEALELLKEHDGNLVCVLLDLMMPKMDGKQTFAEMKRLNLKTPAILCSGYNETDDVESLLDEGLRGFIQKPFTIQFIRDTLKEILFNQKSTTV